jgi:hypothetical protein
MFKRTLVFFSCFLAVTCAIAYWDHVRLRRHDKARYQKFVVENSSQRARHALETHPATQNRQVVQKDFWIMQESERQHLRIQSQESELIIHERKGKLEAVEKLLGLDCWLQDPGNHPISILQKKAIGKRENDNTQQVRHLTAQEGIYFYPSHHFIAQTVHMQFFRLPGHDLPEAVESRFAFFSGTATEACFSACGKSPLFTAQHLHASFDPTKSLP